MQQAKLTKKQKRDQLRQAKSRPQPSSGQQDRFNFQLAQVQALTPNQQLTMDLYEQGHHLLLTGSAGTGKTFLSVYLAMREIMQNQSHDKLTIVRSAVSTREIGHLPGTHVEKGSVYEAPYISIFSELFNRGDAYSYLKSRKVVDFVLTSFVRGTTLSDTIVLVDEFQNMTAEELHTVITRVGKNCKIIFCGDIRQTDLNRRKEKSGFSDFFKVIDQLDKFGVVQYTKDDIVRSGLVKQYIIARERLEDSGCIESL